MSNKTDNERANGQPEERTAIELTQPQRDRLAEFIEELKNAEANVRLAQERAMRELDLVQKHANDFLTYCAQEHGVILGGPGGWIFDQSTFRFVKPDQAQNGA